MDDRPRRLRGALLRARRDPGATLTLDDADAELLESLADTTDLLGRVLASQGALGDARVLEQAAKLAAAQARMHESYTRSQAERRLREQAEAERQSQALELERLRREVAGLRAERDADVGADAEASADIAQRLAALAAERAERRRRAALPADDARAMAPPPPPPGGYPAAEPGMGPTPRGAPRPFSESGQKSPLQGPEIGECGGCGASIPAGERECALCGMEREGVV
jgi:hypothetical protein